MENFKKVEGIVIKGYYGTWYIIDTITLNNKSFALLEHEEYGDEAESIIIDENYNLICDEWYDSLELFFEENPEYAEGGDK